MLFRNLTLFRFVPDATLAESLDAALGEHVLKPVPPLAMFSRGWVSPYGRGAEALALAQGPYLMLALGGEDRILPPAVVNEALAEKIAAATEQHGRPPGGRERKRMREDVLTDLIPRAFVRPSRLGGYLDLERGWLAIDTASRKAAESFVSALRETLGSFAAIPPDPAEAPRSLLTAWLRDAALPSPWRLGEECEMKDPVERGAVVRCRRQDLTADEVGEHLKSGKQASMLELAFDERVSFVLDEQLVMRKLKFLESATAELEGSDRDSAAAEMDARFAVLSLTLAPLLDALASEFKLAAPGSRTS